MKGINLFGKFFKADKKGTISFGNLTGSGLPIEYVRANRGMFPLATVSINRGEREATQGDLKTICGGGGGGGPVIAVGSKISFYERKHVADIPLEELKAMGFK